jgi:hypothetical protein
MRKLFFASVLLLAVLFSTNSVSGETVEKTDRPINETIYFTSGSSTLSSESLKTLDKLLAMMQKDPALEMIIEGHSDADGPSGSNLKLSMARALAVKQWMVKAGINAARLRSRGFGESKSIAGESPAEDRARNRRVEIRMVRPLATTPVSQKTETQVVDSGNGPMASAVIPQSHYEFGPVVEGKEILHDFIIANKGEGPLHIEQVKTG